MRHIYTFVSRYGGFTAITQHEGATIEEALRHWVDAFSFQMLEEQDLTRDQIAVLKRDVSEAKPISLDSFVSMWFVSSTLGKKEPITDGVFGIEILDTRLPSDGANAA